MPGRAKGTYWDGALGLFRLMKAGNPLVFGEEVKVGLKMESSGSFPRGCLKMARQVKWSRALRCNESKAKWKS